MRPDSIGPVGRSALAAVVNRDGGELRTWLSERGWPPWHVKQIRRWLLRRRADRFAVMTDLPRQLRLQLEAEWPVFATEILSHQQAKDGTHKLLFALADGQRIEAVLIQEGSRRSACISTQAGCGMGCVFCASGLDGLARNLTRAEIVEQLVRIGNLLPPGERLNRIVVMGMGEPLANLDQLLPALDLATSTDGLGLSARHITVSTVGLPQRIRQLADHGKPFHLAVSLHAPNDELRSRIIPTNRQTGLDAILEAADYYFARVRRQVTYEYILLRGINDSLREARELRQLLGGRVALVNLIPFNEVAGLPYRRPADAELKRFVECLRQGGLRVKVRKRKGSEIDAACGQLRRRLQPTEKIRLADRSDTGPSADRRHGPLALERC